MDVQTGPKYPDNIQKKRLWTDIRYVNSQCDASIAYMDTCLSTLFQYLENQGILEDTLLIITAGHGEGLDEHQPWYDDHHGFYRTNCHVPLIVHCPDVVRPQRLNGIVTLKDIVPTILGYTGKSDLMEREKIEGKSLRAIIDSYSYQGITGTVYRTECD